MGLHPNASHGLAPPYDAAPPVYGVCAPCSASQGVPETVGVGAEEPGAGDDAGGWLLAAEVVGVGVPLGRC